MKQKARSAASDGSGPPKPKPDAREIAQRRINLMLRQIQNLGRLKISMDDFEAVQKAAMQAFVVAENRLRQNTGLLFRLGGGDQ